MRSGNRQDANNYNGENRQVAKSAKENNCLLCGRGCVACRAYVAKSLRACSANGLKTLRACNGFGSRKPDEI